LQTLSTRRELFFLQVLFAPFDFPRVKARSFFFFFLLASQESSAEPYRSFFSHTNKVVIRTWSCVLFFPLSNPGKKVLHSLSTLCAVLCLFFLIYILFQHFWTSLGRHLLGSGFGHMEGKVIFLLFFSQGRTPPLATECVWSIRCRFLSFRLSHCSSILREFFFFFF